MSVHSAILGLAGAALAALSIPAQSQDHRALAEEAERAGDLARAVSEYATLLQSQLAEEDELSIRGKAIDLCQKLPARLAVPEEALRRFARARAFAKAAKTKGEFRIAADEYREGLNLAPCEADAYFNYALVLEIAEQAERAISALKLYVRAAPNAPDAAKVRAKIYELEAAREMQTRRAQADTENEQRIRQALVGRWIISQRCAYGAGETEMTIEKVAGTELSITGGAWNGSFKGGNLDGKSVTIRWGNALNAVTYTGTIVSPSQMEGTYAQSVVGGGVCSWRAKKL